MKVRLLTALCGLALAAACASTRPAGDRPPAGGLDIGVARVDITPDTPIRLTGYGNRSVPAALIAQRLWAKAVAFGADGSRPSVLITTDLVAVPRHLTEDVARRLASAGVIRPHLAISATHTHTGPSLTGVLPHIFSTPLTPDQQSVIDRYTKDLADKLERVARAALADRQPAQLSWGRGRLRFAAHRRVTKDGKWTAFGVDPHGPVDHDMPLLSVRAADGRLRAVVVNYACHATTLDGNDNYIHGDWPGAAQALIEQRHPGAVAMITIGAGADANPAPRGHGMTDVERHALEVAREVDRVLATPLRRITAPPAGRLQDLDVAFSRLPDRQEWADRATRQDPGGFLAQAIIARLDRGERLAATAPYLIQAWTFGRQLAMVFLAGEVVSEYSLRLKRELDGERLWISAYSNDVPFYVASRRMIAEGGYEVDRSMVYYGQPSPLAEGTEDRIIDAVRSMLRGSFSGQAGR